MTRLLIRLLPGALVLAVSAAQPASAQSKDGENWEVTSQMQMAGMPAGMQMPQQPPRKVCRARNSDNPPVDGGDKCTMSDVRRSGNAVTWKMACERGSGTGEMTYIDKDNYKGTVTMSVSGQTMTVNMTGRRLPGDCDPGEQKRQIATQIATNQQRANDAMARQCQSAVDTMMPYMLRPETGLKCDPKYKADLCTKVQTPEGFATIAPRQPSQVATMPSGDLKEVGDFCGFNPTTVRMRLCKTAEDGESLGFLGSSCVGFAHTDGSPTAKPADTFGSTIIARECAGRTFSSPPAQKYREFCSVVARHNLMQQPATADAASTTTANAQPEEKKDDVATRGKKLLKDIFNR